MSQYAPVTQVNQTASGAMSAPSPKTSAAQMRLLVLLVVAVFINYIDRANLSVSTAEIMKELGLNYSQMGDLGAAFFFTYAFCQLLSGWLIDRFEVRLVLGVGFLIWSLATAATGLANSFTLLILFRLLLGFGESVAYPAFSKIIAANYAEDQRGKANAFIDAGSKFGPALGILIGGLVVANLGWRSLFLILGFGALAWLPFWLMWAPRTQPQTAAQRKDIYVPSMLEILGKRSVWGTFFGLFGINYAWYFMVTWFPPYLIKARHFSTERMAVLGWLPFLMIGIAAMIAGWWADRLISQGGSPTKIRKRFLVTGMLANTLLLPAGMAESDLVSMTLFLIACFAFGFTTANHWAVTQTMAGAAAAGKWTGMQNAFGNLAGVIAPKVTGMIVDQTGSFYWAFVAVAVIAFLGALSFAFIIEEIKPIQWGKSLPGSTPEALSFTR